jgi:translocation and assembly module TamB
LNAAKIGKPGVARLTGLSLKADAAGEARSQLSLDLAIAAVDTPDQPGLRRNILPAPAAGHSLTASAEVAGKNLLNLAVDGGLSTDFSQWQGRLLEAKMNSADKSRNFHLAAPAPIKLASAGWNFGPAKFLGDPLDWQATLLARPTPENCTPR